MVLACPIIAIDIHDLKLEMAKQFGATLAFLPRETTYLFTRCPYTSRKYLPVSMEVILSLVWRSCAI